MPKKFKQHKMPQEENSTAKEPAKKIFKKFIGNDPGKIFTSKRCEEWLVKKFLKKLQKVLEEFFSSNE